MKISISQKIYSAFYLWFYALQGGPRGCISGLAPGHLSARKPLRLYRHSTLSFFIRSLNASFGRKFAVFSRPSALSPGGRWPDGPGQPSLRLWPGSGYSVLLCGPK
jgi:hypothetical protein